MFTFADARSHRIIRTRGGTSGNGDVGDSDDPAGEERRQRVCSLAAAALEVVNRTIDNLELFKGLLCFPTRLIGLICFP